MCAKILYLKSKRRMPVAISPVLLAEDLEDIPPPAWCIRCLREVYETGSLLCRRCKGEENGKEFEEESLSDLYQGDRP